MSLRNGQAYLFTFCLFLHTAHGIRVWKSSINLTHQRHDSKTRAEITLGYLENHFYFFGILEVQRW